ncbi:MAG: Hsp20/alpha crystallin family protein [Turneriella sp.]
MSFLKPWIPEDRDRLLSDMSNRMNALQREFNQFFDNVAGNWRSSPIVLESEKFFNRFVPSINVRENDKEIIVTAELPGLEEKDIHVSHSDNELILEGEKKIEKRDEKDKAHIIESSYGSFRRIIGLPTTIDLTKIDAKFKNGVLTITLPKNDKAKENTKKIEVKPG